MESSEPSNSRSLSAVKQDAETSSDTSSVFSGESSGRRDVDSPAASALSTKSEEYRLLFRLPTDEVLVQDFNCAIQENILLQGHMYLFLHHVCFYSNIFGFETKKVIAFHEITCVRKAKTAAIFPNAIEVVAAGKKFFFGSFLSRDEAYRLLIEGWAQHNSDVKAILDNQDSKSEVSIQDDGSAFEQANGYTELKDELPASDRNNDFDASGNHNLISNGKSDSNIPITENASLGSRDIFTLQIQDVAPKIPEHFTMVAEARFPISVEEFFNCFVSDNATDFLQEFHIRCGDRDLTVSPWQRQEEFSHTRSISFLHPVKIPIGAKYGQCQEIQNLCVYKNSHLVIETSQQIGNVPFGDCFKVQGIWDVERNSTDEDGCTLRVYITVVFSKKTLFKGKIDQSTKEECREVFGMWISNAHGLLKHKDAGKLKDDSVKTKEMIKVASRNCTTDVEQTEMVHTSTSKAISPVISNSGNTKLQFSSFIQYSLEYTTTFYSAIKDLWNAFCSYASQRRRPFVLIAAFAAFFILMQITIIILIMREPKVRLVAQENYMSSFNRYSMDNLDLLEKRFYYLKHEMMLVETHLERLNHEYELLKDHLQNLELLKSKL